MCHLMLRYNFIAIFALFAFGITLKIFLHSFFLRHLIIMHGYGFDIYLLLWLQNECFNINKPPISSLVLNKITYKLFEFYFQMLRNELYNIFYIFESLRCKFLTYIFNCSKSFNKFSIYYEFWYLWNFGLRCVFIIRVQGPWLMVPCWSPACSNYGWFDTGRFYELLNNTDLVSCSQHQGQNCLNFRCTYNFDLVASRTSISVCWL